MTRYGDRHDIWPIDMGTGTMSGVLQGSQVDLMNRNFAGQSDRADFESRQSSLAGSEPNLTGCELENLNSEGAEVKAWG